MKVEAVKEDEVFFCEKQTFCKRKRWEKMFTPRRWTKLHYYFYKMKKAKENRKKKMKPQDPITSKKQEEQNIQKWRRRLVVNKD